jgi:hypothetical protein
MTPYTRKYFEENYNDEQKKTEDWDGQPGTVIEDGNKTHSGTYTYRVKVNAVKDSNFNPKTNTPLYIQEENMSAINGGSGGKRRSKSSNKPKKSAKSSNKPKKSAKRAKSRQTRRQRK